VITLLLVLSLAAILRGIAWIVEGVSAWAHPEPERTWAEYDADLAAYAERRAREYLAEQRAR